MDFISTLTKSVKYVIKKAGTLLTIKNALNVIIVAENALTQQIQTVYCVPKDTGFKARDSA